MARDACGNAASGAPARLWSAKLRAAGDSDTQVKLPLQFHTDISTRAELPRSATSAGCAVLTYRADVAGDHHLAIKLGGRLIGGSPSVLTAVAPVWGDGLAQGIAGEPARLYVRLRAEGEAIPGTASGRRLMHRLPVVPVLPAQRSDALFGPRPEVGAVR